MTVYGENEPPVFKSQLEDMLIEVNSTYSVFPPTWEDPEQDVDFLVLFTVDSKEELPDFVIQTESSLELRPFLEENVGVYEVELSVSDQPQVLCDCSSNTIKQKFRLEVVMPGE